MALWSRPCLATLMYEPAGEIGSKIPAFRGPTILGRFILAPMIVVRNLTGRLGRPQQYVISSSPGSCSKNNPVLVEASARVFAVAAIARTRRGRRRGNIVVFLIISALGLATVKFNRLSAIDYLSSEQVHPSRKEPGLRTTVE